MACPNFVPYLVVLHNKLHLHSTSLHSTQHYTTPYSRLHHPHQSPTQSTPYLLPLHNTASHSRHTTHSLTHRTHRSTALRSLPLHSHPSTPPPTVIWPKYSSTFYKLFILHPHPLFFLPPFHSFQPAIIHIAFNTLHTRPSSTLTLLSNLSSSTSPRSSLIHPYF